MSSAPSALPKKTKSGFVAALEYTGIPPSLLKRPSLPSRNWLIFLGVTGSLISAYAYDRRQCRTLKEKYVEQVKALGEGYSWGSSVLTKDAHLAWPRKLTVYGAKWPGDEDYDQCMRYFRRYIKPIFVAAAIDYDMVVGKKHGDIANRISDEVKARRLTSETSAGSVQPSSNMPPQYYSPSASDLEALRLSGGTVIIGRVTMKEYMAGLVRGWTEPCQMNGSKNWGDEAREEKIRELLDDQVFDEVLTAEENSVAPSAVAFTLNNTVQTSPLPPIPPLPPILLVPFTDYLGFSQIPYMIFDFFYKRRHVRDGGEAALRAVLGAERGFDGPTSPADITTPPQGGDLDFALSTESYYRSSLFESSSQSPLASIAKRREKYYAELPARLWVAREFARQGGFDFEPDGDNPSTKPEWKAAWQKAKSAYSSDPTKLPPTEVELRMERFEKEKKWRAEEEGWEVVRPERGVMWDERLGRERVLKVFKDDRH